VLTAPTRRRAKEAFTGLAELAPVRLIGGFVCVDSHLGCVGCSFCLNRRYPLQRVVLERRLHRGWGAAGLPPDRLGALVAALPAVRRGGVPIRFGHASDLAFEVDGARALLAALPPDRPAMLLTRFPPSAEVAALVADHPNALLHLSVTPPGPGLDPGAVDPLQALAAAAAVPPARLFVALGPLVEGSEGAATRLLEAVPPGAAVGLKPLAREGVPFETGAAPLASAGLAALLARSKALGLSTPPMAGCRLRANLARPFFRHRELLVEAPGACAACANLAACAAVPLPDDEALRTELEVLGLEPGPTRRGPGGVEVEVTVEVARADEAYLSEALGLPVYLSGVRRGGAYQVVTLGAAVLRRWEAVGFYPATTLHAAARRMATLLGLEALVA
jgi:hypothetical protein